MSLTTTMKPTKKSYDDSCSRQKSNIILILAVSDITTTVVPLTHRCQRRKKTNCLPHFRVLNLKNFSMNPAMMGSQEQKMMNSR